MFLSCDHYFSVIIILLQYLTETWYYLVLVRKNKSLPIWLLYFETKYVFKTDGGQQPRMIHPPHIRLYGGKLYGNRKFLRRCVFFCGVLSTTICQLKLNWKGGTFKESFYPACGHPVEDLYHIDVQCPPAKQLILEGGAYNHRFTGCKLPDPHPASWTCDLLSAKVCSQADAALIISGTWSLWNGRNYRKHGRREEETEGHTTTALLGDDVGVWPASDQNIIHGRNRQNDSE